MRLRKSFLVLALFTACATKIPPEDTYRAGDTETAIRAQQALAMEPGREQALHSARLASMAHASGDLDLAERALRVAVSQMQDFTAEGEFQALIVREEAKEWKGEPYEKIAAFFHLGMLLYQKGDEDNALAMFKSAIIADAGTTEERYRSDFVPGYLMQALAYQTARESSNAQQAMGRAIDALYAREVTDLLADALGGVDAGDVDADAEQLARVFLLNGLPAGVTVAAREPAEATRAAVSQATDIANVQRGLSRGDRHEEYKGVSDREFEEAFGIMSTLSEGWRRAAEAIPEDRLAGLKAQGDALEGLLSDAPNVVLVVESGAGPRKIATGEYSEVLQIVPSGRPHAPLVARLGDASGALYLDSYTWQGTTRGSRKVDGFLKGKAIYKDVSFFSGYALARVAEIAAMSDNNTLATASAIASIALLVSSVVTNPEADTREWGLLPDGLYLVTATLPPGQHDLRLGSREYTLEVPERGQLTALIPALQPGGAQTIAPR